MPPKVKSPAARQTALEKFEAGFIKDMGGGITHNDEVNPYVVCSTGSLNLDHALGVGGLPDGRVIEMWGPEHAGKTTLALAHVVEKQRQYPDKPVAWIDMEQTLDRAWAQKLGVDLKRLWIRTPETAEEVADATKRFVYSDLFSMVVLDSVGGMVARVETEKEADEEVVGKIPKIVTRMVRVASPRANKNGTTVIVINQIRAKIGGHGNPDTTGGGWALKHISTIKLHVRRASSEPRTVTVEGKQVPVGHEIAVRVEKNKCAPYGRVANLWLTNQASDKWGPVGFDKVDEAFTFGKRLDLLGERGGGYFTMPDGTSIRNGDNVKDYLREHPDLVEQIRQAALDTVKETIVSDGLAAPDLPVEDQAESEALDKSSGEIVTHPDFATARHGA